MSPTTHVEVGCFPPHVMAAPGASPWVADAIAKAQSVLQGFELLGYTINWIAAGKVVFAAAMVPAANYAALVIDILEAIAANAATIFVPAPAPAPAPPTPVNLRAVFSMVA